VSIYKDTTDPAVTRSIEPVDNGDTIGFVAKVALNRYSETLTEVTLVVDPADVRAFIAELTEIADKRGL
jgi:hypothetical protein